MKILIFTILFFLIGAFFIISENNLALGKSGNVDKTIGLYYMWISHLFDNTLAMTGDVVRMNWLPEIRNINVSNSTG